MTTLAFDSDLSSEDVNSFGQTRREMIGSKR